MSNNIKTFHNSEIRRLLELSARMGSNPLLTQASTGNASTKLNGLLWIKASGKWMADAWEDHFLVSLNLGEVEACLRENIDPAERYPRASVETSMHAVLPHRVVLHVHCVNTIAWAVRQDAPAQLREKLSGLRWQWLPYVASGLPLARAIGQVLAVSPNTDILVLGNHGLVIGGENCMAVENLLNEVRKRLDIRPRAAHPADFAALAELADRWSWDLPDDDDVHALATDATSQTILSRGFLYPCQAIFSNCSSAGLFCPAPFDAAERELGSHATLPFVIVQERGVLFNRSMTSAERAMMSGLAQVVQRISCNAPIRYLTEFEVADIASKLAYRYRELANAGRGSAA